MNNNLIIFLTIALLSTFLHSMQKLPTTFEDEHIALLQKKLSPNLAQTNTYHQSPIIGLSFLPYENILVAASLIKEVAIMDVTTNKILNTISSPPKRYSKYYHRWLYSLALSPAGIMFATGFSDGDIEIHDTKTGTLISKLKDYDDITSLAFSPSELKLYAASASSDTISIWDILNNKRLGNIPLKTSFFVDNTHLSVCDNYLATSDASFTLYNLSSHKPLHLGKSIPFLKSSKFVEFAPNMRSLVVAASSLKVSRNTIFHLLSLDEHNKFSVKQFVDRSSYGIHRTSDISFQPNTHTIATSSITGTIRLWDHSTCNLIQKWHAHKSRTHTSFSPDGSILTSGAGGGTIKFWKQPES